MEKISQANPQRDLREPRRCPRTRLSITRSLRAVKRGPAVPSFIVNHEIVARFHRDCSARNGRASVRKHAGAQADALRFHSAGEPRSK